MSHTTIDPRRHRRTWFGRGFSRIGAFFSKELIEVIRQPRLIISLVGGPLLVLVLFGISFQNSTPRLRTMVVLPPDVGNGVDIKGQLEKLAGLNFAIQGYTESREEAEAALRAGKVDVVQVIPTDFAKRIGSGERPAIEFLSNALDPMSEGWIQYLGYAEITEINRALLRTQAVSAQQRATGMQGEIGKTKQKLDLFDASQGKMSQQDIDSTRESMRDFQRSLSAFEAVTPSGSGVGGQRADTPDAHAVADKLSTQLDALDRSIADKDIAAFRRDVAQTRQSLDELNRVIAAFIAIPPDTLVAPVEQKYVNIRGGAYSAVVFYAPGVLALLIQHTAITLGALSLVRERLMGANEIFRVSPVGMWQLLIGKVLGYTLFIGLTAALLVALLLPLGVPLLGSIAAFAGVVLLLTLASLSVGFVISAISNSDSQAIQLSMITLLLSIFFSGFFISLDSFARPALVVSWMLPITHGVAAFKNVMLRGIMPPWETWVGLGGILLVSFALVVLLTGRQFRRA